MGGNVRAEICVCMNNTYSLLSFRGKSLELLKPDPNTGKVHTLLTAEVFGVIRSLMAFRLTGGAKGKRRT